MKQVRDFALLTNLSREISIYKKFAMEVCVRFCWIEVSDLKPASKIGCCFCQVSNRQENASSAGLLPLAPEAEAASLVTARRSQLKTKL
jgi:hypothetical protein